MSEPLFEVRGLSVAILDQDAAAARVNHGFVDQITGKPLGAGWVPGVTDIDFSVHRGEALAIVGESGMGKTLAVMAAFGLLGPTARIVSGEMRYDGERFDPARMLETDQPKPKWWQRRKDSSRWLGETLDPVYARIMGNHIGFVFQDPISSWDPIPMIGQQAGEVLDEHTDMTVEEIEARVVEILGEVKLPAQEKFWSFAHELSRGQAQRAMLAAALVNGPSLLVADEPFTGLDPPVAQGIAELIADMRRRRGLAMIMVNHDLAQVASLADRMAVVYGGRIVEQGTVEATYRRPRHPYTEGLLGAVPWPDAGRLRPVRGETPRLVDVPQGMCPFTPRCDHAVDLCMARVPPRVEIEGTEVACVRAHQLELRGVSG